MKKLLEGRSVMFFVELAAALVALVCAILYLIICSVDDNSFGATFFILMLLAAACVVVHLFIRLDVLPFAAAVLAGVSVGIIIYEMLPTLSDVWNGVNFIGGNLPAYIVYTALSAVSAIALIVCCFTGTQKKEAPAA